MATFQPYIISALLGMNGNLCTVTGEPFSQCWCNSRMVAWVLWKLQVIKAWIDCSIANSDCVFMIPCLSLEPAGAGTLQQQWDVGWPIRMIVRMIHRCWLVSRKIGPLESEKWWPCLCLQHVAARSMRPKHKKKVPKWHEIYLYIYTWNLTYSSPWK